jgi:hypothetical protein
MVYDRLLPAVTGWLFSALVTSKSVNGLTVVTTESELLLVTRSVSLAETAAVLVTAPAWSVVIEMVAITELPEARFSKLHTTVVVPMQFPWATEAEIGLAPSGSESVRVTSDAFPGPLLVTPIVYMMLSP